MHSHLVEIECHDCARKFRKTVVFGITEYWTNVECPQCGQMRPADHPEC